MSQTETNKALLRRWYDEMWANCNFDLIPELAGPSYTRHDVGGERTVSGEEYRDQLNATSKDWEISNFHYWLMAEGDFVTSVGTWTINSTMTWDWVQTFRIEDGRIVETWLPAFATEGKWTREQLPQG